jgi:hypothetical protein
LLCTLPPYAFWTYLTYRGEAGIQTALAAKR